jgi:small subunit ribosomal protein S17
MNKDGQEKNNQGQRRFQGKVVSVKMQETAVVEVATVKLHAKYKKGYKSTKRFNCHNADNQFKVGERVVCAACRPLSKTKRWRIISKVN